ncbi:hypothetical protein SCHPADRAFT_8239 [Schizopora paradoxa]|uniref:Uncharacterized protein n=1 Tax=Schizopora paradoxa TaxID=27342 RepID=A0A0H2S9H3_9AGAM|nr:hypothetical protein SCHPADRAFT_8239 [Schizopora paradoxa]
MLNQLPGRQDRRLRWLVHPACCCAAQTRTTSIYRSIEPKRIQDRLADTLLGVWSQGWCHSIEQYKYTGLSSSSRTILILSTSSTSPTSFTFPLQRIPTAIGQTWTPVTPATDDLLARLATEHLPDSITSRRIWRHTTHTASNRTYAHTKTARARSRGNTTWGDI